MVTSPSPGLTASPKPRLKLIPGQANLLADYDATILAAIAGTGGGKTALAYLYLHDRLLKYPGYTWGLAEPTYQMLEKIIINSPDPDRPDLITYLGEHGFQPRYKSVAKILETNRGKIYLGSADNPNTMQGAAVRGYILDEGGMMEMAAYETAVQRVNMLGGQVLITTTPYNLGWLKTEVNDKADGDIIHVETWRSIDRPGYPRESYEIAKRIMARRRFLMMFDAVFEKPEGLIYAAFDDEKCFIPRFDIPADWPCYVGMDFGGVNTAAMWYAIDPETSEAAGDLRIICYREYLEGGMTARVHAEKLKELSKGENIRRRIGGAPSEGQWRLEFGQAGWPVMQPRVRDVEIGIDRVSALHEKDYVYYFDNLVGVRGEKSSYCRVLDPVTQEPTEKIQDKEKYHRLDAERYVLSDIRRSSYAFESG